MRHSPTTRILFWRVFIFAFGRLLLLLWHSHNVFIHTIRREETAIDLPTHSSEAYISVLSLTNKWHEKKKKTFHFTSFSREHFTPPLHLQHLKSGSVRAHDFADHQCEESLQVFNECNNNNANRHQRRWRRRRWIVKHETRRIWKTFIPECRPINKRKFLVSKFNQVIKRRFTNFQRNLFITIKSLWIGRAVCILYCNDGSEQLTTLLINVC